MTDRMHTDQEYSDCQRRQALGGCALCDNYVDQLVMDMTAALATVEALAELASEALQELETARVEMTWQDAALGAIAEECEAQGFDLPIRRLLYRIATGEGRNPRLDRAERDAAQRRADQYREALVSIGEMADRARREFDLNGDQLDWLLGSIWSAADAALQGATA